MRILRPVRCSRTPTQPSIRLIRAAAAPVARTLSSTRQAPPAVQRSRLSSPITIFTADVPVRALCHRSTGRTTRARHIGHHVSGNFLGRHTGGVHSEQRHVLKPGSPDMGGECGGFSQGPDGALTTAASAAAYQNCAAPCMFTMALSHNDTLSAPFYDYHGDALYVGDDSGNLHQFTGVFNGVPTESGGTWPVNLGTSNKLASPVYDGTWNGGQVFVGDLGGVTSTAQRSTGAIFGQTSISGGTDCRCSPDRWQRELSDRVCQYQQQQPPVWVRGAILPDLTRHRRGRNRR